MENAEYIINKIESSLTQTLNAVKELTPDNFLINFETAYNQLDNARKLRTELNENELPEHLQNRLRKMNLTAKLIEKAYDNVIGNHKAEIENIALSIKNVGKEKKIATYTRG